MGRGGSLVTRRMEVRKCYSIRHQLVVVFHYLKGKTLICTGIIHLHFLLLALVYKLLVYLFTCGILQSYLLILFFPFSILFFVVRPVQIAACCSTCRMQLPSHFQCVYRELEHFSRVGCKHCLILLTGIAL